MEDTILSGNIFKALTKVAVPLMLINVINALYSLADTYFIGRVGELQVGAISLSMPISDLGRALATGLAAATMALVSRYVGAQNKEKGNHVATLIMGLCIIFGILSGVIVLLFIEQLLMLVDTPAEIYLDTKTYLSVMAFDYLFMFILTIFSAIRQANGDTKTGLYINSAAGILNIILDFFFIEVFSLSIFGAALATVLSKVLVTPIAFYILLTSKTSTTINFKKYKLNMNIGIEVFRIAIPSSIGYFLSSIGFLTMNRYIVSYGTLAMSGYGLGNRIGDIFYIPVGGYGAALAPFIGQNLGAKNFDRLKKSYKVALWICIVLSLILNTIGIMLRVPLITFFVKDASAELIKQASGYLLFSLGTSIFVTWHDLHRAVFNGTGNASVALLINISRLWLLRIPLIYLFDKFTNYGITGIWLSMFISNIVIAALGEFWYQKYFLKVKLVQYAKAND